MIKEEVDAINNSGVYANIAATGGGSKFIGDFLSFGGGSNTIYGFYVPYSTKATDEYIGYTPEKYVSAETAEALAVEAFRRCNCEDDTKQVYGIGVTCKLTTGVGERAGRQNLIYLAYADADTVNVFGIDLHKNFKDVPTALMTRTTQETLTSELIHDLLFKLATQDKLERFDYDWGTMGTKKYALRESYKNEYPTVEYLGKKEKLTKELIVFPGSFNPIHAAHKEMATLVMDRFPMMDFAFELSVRNFDKGSILPSDLNRRLTGLSEFSNEVFVSNCVLLKDKADAFHTLGHKVTFVIGFDTFIRWADSTDIKEVRAMIHLGVQFIVIPRGGFSIKTSEMARYPNLIYDLISDLIHPLSYDVEFQNFNNPISSTQIRNETAK